MVITFKKLLTEASQKVHWKKSKFSDFAACDKRGADKLKLANCKHTDDIHKITCKKCQKEYLGSGAANPGGGGKWRPDSWN